MALWKDYISLVVKINYAVKHLVSHIFIDLLGIFVWQ